VRPTGRSLTATRSAATASLLETVLDSGIDVPYPCTGGICGTCRTAITHGAVHMQQNDALSDDPHVARDLSYLDGTALVAPLHRHWTFRTAGVRGALGWTALVYATTFAVVLITHGLAFAVLPAVVAAPCIMAGAWCVSQGLGTTINFLVLRGAVFR
jgi:hypothetical protein